MILARLVLAITLFLVPAPAFANAEDFVQITAAGMVDDQCHVYKFTERTLLNELASQALAEEPHYQKWLTGSLGEDNYTAWFNDLTAQASTLSQSLGCDAGAMQLLTTARGAVTSRLYQDLVLATYFHQLAPGDSDRWSLTVAESWAVRAFGGLVQQLYGASFAQFSETNKQAVGALLPPAEMLPPVTSVPDPLLSIGGMDYSKFGGGMDYEEMEARRQTIQGLQSRARTTVGLALLEVTAEENGFLARTSDKGVASLVRATDGQRLEVIHRGPFQLADGPKTYTSAILVSTPNYRIRLLPYGRDEKINAAFLLVGKGPSKENGGTAPSTSDAEWRTEADILKGRPLTDGCLGGGCFEFPRETYDALLAVARMDYAELVISNEPDATEPPAGARQNRVLAAVLQDVATSAK